MVDPMGDPVRKGKSKIRRVLLWTGWAMMLGCIPVSMALICMWLYRNGWDLTWPLIGMVFFLGLCFQQAGIGDE